ncbi:hypothetical protein C7S18_13020 [Ahniella affigens]|uniref:Histidine phosphatase family protein n=1 Tax=Ahniella affigens TaxID=2021234 RepID=A0A2P1PT89_9GAMM|nr:histidine phosphatase family protein [Ahniella affigens]AVP98063.1 hypothetical protein C7S18_13020 [Ahniella affigens]
MLELLTIRHAQASFDADDYDQLSTKGELQAERLGRHLAADPGYTFDAVIVGAMKRHEQTYSAIQSAYAEGGRDLPNAITLAAFNEFDHGAVLSAFLSKYPDHSSLVAGRMPAKDDRGAVAQFIAAALMAWAQGLLDDRLDESFPAFQHRVHDGLFELIQQHQGRSRLLLVSSGGVIAQIAGLALQVPAARTIDFNLSLMNTGLSSFHWRGASLHLASWNSLPHLAGADGRAMQTFV